MLIHPSPFLKDISYSLYNNDRRLEVTYYLNDVFVILSFFRNIVHIILVFRATKWNSSRIQRINLFYQKKDLSNFLPMKIYLANNFIPFIIYSLLLSIFIFSGFLMITERPLSVQSDH